MVLYLFRHTWGFQEFDKPKKLTTDEFMKGRKKKDGTRLDDGTGLSDRGVKNGLAEAIKHGYIVYHVDDSDKGRIKKYYMIKVFQRG